MSASHSSLPSADNHSLSRRHSLRRRLSTSLASMLLATLMLIEMSVVVFIYRAEGSAWRGRQEEAARNAAQTVAGFVQRSEDSLNLIGIMDPDYLRSNPDVLNDFLSATASLLEVVRVDAGGQVVANHYKDRPVLASLFTIPQSQWFLEAKASRRYLGSVQRSSQDEPYLVLAVPASDGGVVGARLWMNVLWDVVADIHFGQAGQVYVMDSNGQVVAYTDRQLDLTSLNLRDRPEFTAIQAAPQAIWAGEYVNPQGTRVVGASAPVEGTDWVVLTEQPQAEAYAMSRTATGVLGGAVLLLAAGMMLLSGRVLAAGIFDPVERLRAGAERIGNGDLAHRIETSRRDEIGQVAEAFNEMASRLKEREDQIAEKAKALAAEVEERTFAQQALQKAKDELEWRVAERTEELSNAIAQLQLELAERKRAEEQLREAEDRFRTLVEQVPAVTYIASLGDDGATLYVSPQIETMLGFSQAEWMADSDLWSQRLHPDDRERVLSEDDYSRNSGEAFSSEYRLIARDGRIVWVHDRSRWVRDEKGEPRFTQGVEFDITERKRAEVVQDVVYQIAQATNQEVSQAELVATIHRSIQKVMLADNFYIALYDRETDLISYLYAVDQYDDEFTLTKGGKSLTAYLLRSGESLLCTNAVFQELLDSGEVELVGTPSPIWLGVPLKIHGEVIGAMVVQDYQNESAYGEREKQLLEYVSSQVAISLQRKRAEDALRVSEERYALAVRGANDGLWDWDLRTDRIYFSPRWKEMLGYGEDEIGDQPQEWFSRVHPDDIHRLSASITSHRDGVTDHFESEHRLLHRDGEYRWVLARGLAVRDAAQSPYRMAGSISDITDRKRAENQLLHDALHDGLTGLPNRSLFMDRLEHSIKSAKRREDYVFAVLFIDIDRFKVINDSLGHMLGDRLLVAIAERLQTSLRPGDTVARLGGDEFAILLDGIKDASDSTHVAERVQQSLRTPFILDGHEISMTASIGIALSASGYDRPEEFLRDADTAMYRAKALGRSRQEIFDAGMHSHVMALLQLEGELRRAIDREELRVYYQPILSLTSGKIVGVEALVRWQHPTRGLLPPAEFIAVAEETGLIVPIGEQVLRAACVQTKIWRETADPELRVAVNFSARQFQVEDLPRRVMRVLQETGLDPQALEIEITESTAMSDVELSLRTLEALTATGIRISIDDFGNSYSALGSLKRFPFKTLKTDRGFIRDIVSDAGDAAITTAIISMAHGLRLRVVAEGVETEAQVDFLRKHLCDEMQGFLFSRPIPAEAMTELLRQERDLWSQLSGLGSMTAAAQPEPALAEAVRAGRPEHVVSGASAPAASPARRNRRRRV